MSARGPGVWIKLHTAGLILDSSLVSIPLEYTVHRGAYQATYRVVGTYTS